MEHGRYVFVSTTIIRVDHTNPLDSIIDHSEVDYGPEKRCKLCNNKLNHINARSSKYCHCCKLKAIRIDDMKYNEEKNITSVRGIIRK